jgi:hypothetical protein
MMIFFCGHALAQSTIFNIPTTVPGNGLLNAGYCIGNDSWEKAMQPRADYYLFTTE